MQEVILGITGTGVRKWLKEGKEAKTDGIYEHSTAVGNCGWIPLGMSGKWCGSHLKSFCTQGANKQGCLSTNSHLQWLRAAPKHTDYIPQPITHKHTCPPICSSGLSCTCAEHVHVARESPQVESQMLAARDVSEMLCLQWSESESSRKWQEATLTRTASEGPVSFLWFQQPGPETLLAAAE